ncbi:craniofacial development protein 1-like isoform X2 [Durio zibethinus]|uniref:Craniofacial development protein 1-like isoform X2 n=1 Tax=Durio zibethinus TaxID=66656 RepID=A0A6P6A7K7_DURZI|nr:craniofacial development protein 1-like isoform X2 [Durio zibethinus]
MATTSNGLNGSGNVNEKEGTLNESVKEDVMAMNSEPHHEDTEAKERVEAMWEQMNKGIPKNVLRQFSSNNSSALNKASPKASNNWMKYLQLRPPKTAGSPGQDRQTDEKARSAVQNGTSHKARLAQVDKGISNATLKSVLKEDNSTGDTKFSQKMSNNSISDEAKKLAAAALAAVKDAAAAAAAASNRGKIEITEVRDFAGQEIEIKKCIDADSKEAAEKAKAHAPSAVDAVLEQIKKKPKLSVLDKTKKDWGEFKEENKGMEEELDAYKKSSNQYLDKVSFLQRADYREFERERDARLALQARRRPDMREEP